VPSHQKGPCLLNLIETALNNLAKNLLRHSLDWAGKYIHGQQGSASHGIDIAQGIGGRDLAETIGIIDYRRKKIQCLDQGCILIETIHSSII